VRRFGLRVSQGRLVEHRDERRAATVLLAKIRDPHREPLALAGRLGGAAGALEHRDGPGVRPAAGLSSSSSSTKSMYHGSA
jgi:hypothetical protein